MPFIDSQRLKTGSPRLFSALAKMLLAQPTLAQRLQRSTWLLVRLTGSSFSARQHLLKPTITIREALCSLLDLFTFLTCMKSFNTFR